MPGLILYIGRRTFNKGDVLKLEQNGETIKVWSRLDLMRTQGRFKDIDRILYDLFIFNIMSRHFTRVSIMAFEG